MKVLVQSIARKFGYQISRIREQKPYPALDVLDLVIRDYMTFKSDIFFLQIGANDGVRADPMHPYVKQYHWRGLLVEPQPQVFKKLVENYADEPQLQFENSLVAHQDGTIPFYTVHDDESRGLTFRYTGLARFDRESLIQELARYGFPQSEFLIKELHLPALSIPSLLAKHEITEVDILQIDTEGFDFEVIKMFDFNRIKPAIIHFEFFHLSLDDQDRCFAYLSEYGYEMVTVLGDVVAYQKP